MNHLKIIIIAKEKLFATIVEDNLLWKCWAEPVFVNFEGARESIPPVYVAWRDK
jgi:hypothetical protein